MRNWSKLFTLSVLIVFFGVFNSSCGPKGGSRPKSEQADGVAGISRSGGYELVRPALMGTCPFISDNGPFNFDGILGAIRSQLETKINGQDTCRAKQQFLSDGFLYIQKSFAKLDQEVADAKSADMYQNFIGEMQLQLEAVQAKNPNDSLIAPMLQSGILSMQDRIRDLQVRSENSHELSQAELRLQMFSRMNDMLVSLGQMKPECVEAIGGWRTLLPPLLGTAALASGHSILSGQVVASAALQLVTSLTGLLQSQSAKQAFQEILRVQNEKVLACTYYSIQHTSCEVKRALKLIEDKKPIIKNIAFHQFELKGPEGKKLPEEKKKIIGEWQKYLDLYSKISQFEPVFNTIATQGSSLSLDVQLVWDYFKGSTVSLASLKPYPAPTEPDSVLSKWLERARRAGMSVNKADNFGNPMSIKEQFQHAIDQANSIELTIDSVEANIKDSKSFEGLKHSLNALNPELIKNTKLMKEFLLDQATQLPEQDRGAVYISAQTMESLETFMTLGINGSSQTDIKNYIDALTSAGTDLFLWISMGSVAQMPKQQILALGGKAQERLKNAFQVIDNRLSRIDIDQMDNNHQNFKETFTAYKQDHLLYYQLADLYNDLKGPNSAFRQSEMDVASGSFEKGFEDELVKMVETKLGQPAGAHFCALMSGFLQKGSSRSASHVLDKCKERFKQLDISTLSLDLKEDIDYNDACYYDGYIRRTRSFQILDWLKRGM